jgi:hypothetical protein
MVVLFTSFIEGPHNENIFSRCKSSLIVVCNEEHAQKIVPDDQGIAFAFSLPVHGNLNPQPTIASSSFLFISIIFWNPLKMVRIGHCYPLNG